MEPACGDAGLRHLHQRQHPLLNAGAATGDDGDERPFLLRGMLQGQRHLLTHHASHAAAHKAKIHYDQHHGSPADCARPGDDRLGKARPPLVLEEALLVGNA